MEYAGQAAEGWKKTGRRTRTEVRPADEAPEPAGAELNPAPAARVTPLTEEERERMMLEHMPAVRWMARRIHERLPQHVDMEDLVSAGTVGLLDGFRKLA